MSTAAATPEAPVAPEASAAIAPVETAAPERIELTPENLRETEIKPADRDALLFGAPVEEATPEPEKPKEDEKPAEETKPEAEAVKPEDEEEEAESVKLPKNFRLHTEDPKLSTFLKALKTAQQTNPTVNPMDVARIVGYETPVMGSEAAPEIPAVASDPNDPIVLTKTEIAAHRSEIAAIRESRKQYAAEPAVFADELAEIETKLDAAQSALTESSTKLAKLELKAELRAEQEAERQQTKRLSARDAAKQTVLQDFPTAGDDDTLLGAEVSRIYAEMQADPKHADHARLAKDDGPQWLVAEKAVPAAVARLVKNLGYTEAQALDAIKGKPIAEAKGPVTAVVRTAVPKAVTTATGIRPAPEPAGTLDDKTILEKARQDPKIRDAALGFGGGWVVR